jgi:hypothetical protein
MTRRNYLDTTGYGPHPDETVPMGIAIGLLLAAAFIAGLVL